MRTKNKDKQSLINEVINYGPGTWTRNFIHLPPLAIDRLLCTLEEDIDEDPVKAVNIVGKNIGNDGHPIWVLNKDTAIDEHGNLISDIKQHGLVWLSHLIDGNGIDIAKEAYQAKIVLPLSNQGFEAICHFLKGTLYEAIAQDNGLQNYIQQIGITTTEENMGHAPQTSQISNNSNENFLSSFCLMSMACIMANYQEVILVKHSFSHNSAVDAGQVQHWSVV